MHLLCWIPSVCYWVSSSPSKVWWYHDGAPKLDLKGLVVFDDETVHQRPCAGMLSLQQVKRAHNREEWPSPWWMPSREMLMREVALYGRGVYRLVERKLLERGTLLYEMLQRKVLPLCHSLRQLTHCELKHALLGNNIKMFNCYVYNDEKLRNLLQRQESATQLEGGEVLHVRPGMVQLGEDERVSILDFSSAYASIGAHLFKGALGDAFRHLIQLRRQRTDRGDRTGAQAVKLFTNAIFYGCLGSPFTKYSLRQAAGKITQRCRQMLQDACAMVRGMEGVRVLAGHTDSLIILHRAQSFHSILRKVEAEVCSPWGVKLKRDEEFLPPRFLVVNRTCYAGVTSAGVVYRGLGEGCPQMVRDVVQSSYLPLVLLEGKGYKEAEDTASHRLRELMQWGGSVERMAHLYSGKASKLSPEGRVKQHLPHVNHPLWMTVQEGQNGLLREHSCSWWKGVLFPDVGWYRKKKLLDFTNRVESALAPPALPRTRLSVTRIAALGGLKALLREDMDEEALLESLLQPFESNKR